MSGSDEVAEIVIGIISDVIAVPSESLTDEEVLAAHGWDSIASLEALALLESEFDITLDLRSFHAAHTVAQMVELVRSGLTARTSAR